MFTFRALLIWLVALSLPLEGMASLAKSHCKDMPAASAESAHALPAGHDHAAMMAKASMVDAGQMAHAHHTQAPGDANADCQCGCDCSGSCALSCAATMIFNPQSGLMFAENGSSVARAGPRARAHAAYRYDPLRPPAAVAL